MMSDFGELLRKYRTRAGLSQGGLAKELGVTVAYVSDVERAARKPFVPGKIHQVAKLLTLSFAEHEALLLHRALEHGSFELPYLDPFATKHNAVAATLQRTWETLTPQELEAIAAVIQAREIKVNVPTAMGPWIRGYSHKTRGGTYEARSRGDGDFDVREPGQEAQRVPGGYFRAEFFAVTPEAREQEKVASIAAEAERLGVDFVLVDDRPIDKGYPNTIRVQARAFAELLQELQVPVRAITKDGLLMMGPNQGEVLLSLTVGELREVLRRAGRRERFLEELLKHKSAQKLRDFMQSQRDLVLHLTHSINDGKEQP